MPEAKPIPVLTSQAPDHSIIKEWNMITASHTASDPGQAAQGAISRLGRHPSLDSANVIHCVRLIICYCPPNFYTVVATGTPAQLHGLALNRTAISD